MKLEEDRGGKETLKALRSYASKLVERYGKQAFRYFNKADMRILSVH